MCSDGSGTMENGEYDRLSLSSRTGIGSVHSVVSAQIAECAIVVLDRTANVTSWNTTAEQVFGYPAETAIGKPIYHFLDLESLTPGSVEWEMLTAYYRGTSTCNRQYVHSDGSRFRATAEVSPLWDGEFVGYTLTFTAVTRADDNIE